MNETKDNRSTILAVVGGGLLRFSLTARDGAWYIAEVENLDEAAYLLGDALRGALDPAMNVYAVRDLQFADPERALKRLDEIIKAQGEKPELLLLRAQTLAAKQRNEKFEAENKPEPGNDEQKAKPEATPAPADAAAEALRQVTMRWPDYAPAQYALAAHYADNEQSEKAIEPYQRYAKLAPLDPRPWQKLGLIFDSLKRPVEAERAYREAIARDRRNYERHVTLAGFFFNRAQNDQAALALAEAFKVNAKAGEVFEAMDNEAILLDEDDEPIAENSRRLETLLTGFAKELAASRAGLRLLSRVQQHQKNYDGAIRSQQRALALGPDAYDHVRIAILHRAARRFAQSLAAADQALKVDAEYAGAHFERACNLAQLGRKREAVKALQKAVELQEYYQQLLDADDLKPLTALPEFKALLPKEEEKKPEAVPPPKPDKL